MVAGSQGAEPASVTVRAGAKVNPLLVIHGRRTDGFHSLTTLMLGFDLYDEVTVAASTTGATVVESTGPFASPDIPTGATNLAARGAQSALEALAQTQALHIQIHKAIPSRAGLGGGSSDAAAAALATLELLHPGWSSAPAAMAMEAQVGSSLGRIGADCAFFFQARDAGAAVASGRGEQVSPCGETPPWHVLIVTPEVDCATPKVYGALELEPQSDAALAEAIESATLPVAAEFLGAPAVAARALLRNDLEAAAERAFPALSTWRAMLVDLQLDHMRLAGSGSSFFGLFDNEREATAAAATLQGGTDSRGLHYRYVGVHRPTGPALLPMMERCHP